MGEVRQEAQDQRDRIRHVLAIVEPFRAPAPAESPLQDERLVYLGPDEDGVMLEVMAVETADGLLVIHAMPISNKYLRYLKEDDNG